MGTIFQALAELEAKNDDGVLCTIIISSGSTPRHAGSKMLVYPDGSFIGSVGGGELEARVIKEAQSALEQQGSKLVKYDMVEPKAGDPGLCGGHVEVYLEPVLGRPEILVIGGGHVGKAVAHLASWLKFRVIVSDDRPEFCTPGSNPDAEVLLPVSMKEIPEQYAIKRHTYIVMTTRGAAIDIQGLPALLQTPAAYIGIIGSKRRWLTTRKAMLEAGISEDLINRIHSPIGLELSAETPEEIAVSIMAEILMVQKGGTGKEMRVSV